MINRKLVFVLLAILVVAACGNPARNGINGEWKAALTPAQGGTPMEMTLDFSTNADGSLSTSISGMTGDNGCLTGLGKPNAIYGKTAGPNGPVYDFQLGVQNQSTTPTGISLAGQLTGDKITGVWNMGGPNLQCNNNGKFTMTPVPGPFLPKGT